MGNSRLMPNSVLAVQEPYKKINRKYLKVNNLPGASDSRQNCCLFFMILQNLSYTLDGRKQLLFPDEWSVARTESLHAHLQGVRESFNVLAESGFSPLIGQGPSSCYSRLGMYIDLFPANLYKLCWGGNWKECVALLQSARTCCVTCLHHQYLNISSIYQYIFIYIINISPNWGLHSLSEAWNILLPLHDGL